MPPVGGLRARMMHMSVVDVIRDSLNSLGWFDPDAEHDPVEVLNRPIPWDEEIVPNKVAVSTEDVRDVDAELGSGLTTDTWDYYCDIYAESEGVGMHLAHDVRDILRGKMSIIGRTHPSIEALDYRHATPVKFATLEVERVQEDRGRSFPEASRRHWRVVSWQIVDTYNSDTGEEP